MAFTIGSLATYKWPLVLSYPDDGQQVEIHLTAVFHRIQHERAMEIIAAMRRVSEGAPMDTDPTETEAVLEVLAGWEGFVAGGEEVKFTPENLEKVISMEMWPFQILTAWAESKNKAKQAEAKRKN